jgi:hypothetical protein
MTKDDEPPPPRQIQMPPRREELDLPPGSVVQTFHNAASAKTITEIRLGGRLPIHNLYWRPAGAARYAPVHRLGEGQTLENAVNCDAAWIFARLQTWTKREHGYSSSNNEVVRIDFTSIPRIETVSLTDILPENATVSRLHRADDSGTRLQAVISFAEPYRDGSARRIRYAICVLDLTNRNVTEMDTLPGIEY